jgi:MSHA pilin protein MshC
VDLDLKAIMHSTTSQIEAIKQNAVNICCRGAMAYQMGFTMVELIVVMILIGILSAIAAPRFFDNSTFQSRGFADQVQASLRYGQKEAIARRRLVCVTFPTTTRMVLRTTANFTDIACNTDLVSPSGSYPAGQTTYTVDAPTGVTLSGYAAFNFDALGKPSSAQAIIVSGAPSNIVVEAETGYVHSP